MHGLINRSIQCFLRDVYGQNIWLKVAETAEIGTDNFEALLPYDDATTRQVISAAAKVLGKPEHEFLEDLGTYLVSHPNLEGIRRLLRFGGETYLEFLYSLDDLQSRASLAVPELQLPKLDLRGHLLGNFTLYSTFPIAGSGHVLVGVLRAMADDYGTLALLDHMGGNSGVETVTIQLLEMQHSEARSFDLSQGVGGDA